MKEHHYSLTVEWTGNTGSGTSTYTSYQRSHSIHIKNKVNIEASSDAAFSGDNTKHNPEDLFLSSLSGCHMLWYLHLCATAGVIVTSYKDEASGTLLEKENGGGHFSAVTLHPIVTVADASMIDKANELHSAANKMCFIASSCNFPVKHQPVCTADNKARS